MAILRLDNGRDGCFGYGADLVAGMIKKTIVTILKALWAVIRWLFRLVTPTRYACSFDPSFVGSVRRVWALSPSKAATKAACENGVRQGQSIYVKDLRTDKISAFVCHAGMFGWSLRGVERVEFNR